MTQPTRKLAAIVFTDIVEFTQITAQDEAAAMSLLKWQRETFKPLVIELGGEWLKEVGDGLLLSFPSSQDAVRCAIRIQEAAREMPDLKLRVGIHQGDIIQEGPDILGDGVNIASRIQRIGLVGDDERDRRVADATILVHPSHYEGFGLPVVEAMASGTPVVTTTAGAIPEIAGDAALMVDPGDVDALASALVHVLGDEQTRAHLIKAGRNRAARFSWADTASGLIEVYDSFL